MDNRFIFLYPYICDVVTEKANRTRLLDFGRSKVPDELANPFIVKGKLRGSKRSNPSSEVGDASSLEKLLA